VFEFFNKRLVFVARCVKGDLVVEHEGVKAGEKRCGSILVERAIETKKVNKRWLRLPPLHVWIPF
jgi:hypothetical protein